MPVRGQGLFVRPITPADRADLERLQPDLPPAAEGLLGRLLGETVSFAATTVAGDELRIDALMVAPHLRRKRIGRVMMMELETLAAALDCTSLVVADPCDAREFFLKVGFAESHSMLRKTLRSKQ